MYPDYKIKRVNKRMSDEKRESLYTQKTRIQQYLEEVFIRQCEFKGYEADDCIAFYCLNNNKEDITILTNDRDLTQLISSNVNLKLLNNLNIVKNGDKIKFVKLLEQNPFRFDVISYITKLPPEFKLQKCVDYEVQFQKTFLDPMRFILEAIGWQAEKQATLEDFFA